MCLFLISCIRVGIEVGSVRLIVVVSYVISGESI